MNNEHCESCGADLIEDDFTGGVRCPYAEEDGTIYCTPPTWFEDFVDSWSWNLRRWENFRFFIRAEVRDIKNKLKRITRWKR